MSISDGPTLPETRPPNSLSKLFSGCIADDLTGATDLGLALSRGGMRAVQQVAPANLAHLAIAPT